MSDAREFVLVNEVGLRDGLQNQPVHVPLEGKVRLERALRAAGIRAIELTSFVSPKAVPQLADAADLLAAVGEAPDMEYSVLVPNAKGYERALASGASTIALVISASETMNRKNINMGTQQVLDVAAEVIARAKTDGVRAKAYVAVAFECPFEGPTNPAYVAEIVEQLLAKGADEIVIADTIGAANPKAVRSMLEMLVASHGAARFAVHFHDTRAMALANAYAALEAGVRRFDSSIGGLGGCPFAPGASGNVATEDLVFMLESCGFRTGIDLDRLQEAVRVAEELINSRLGGRIASYLAGRRQRHDRRTARE